MKIVVIGGSGLIGAQVVTILKRRGHEALAASPATGVNTLTGEGLSEALEGAEVVIDLANSPNFADDAPLTFFETSGRNLQSAERAAGVRHHVALSVVGTDKLSESGYFRGKIAQERLIREGSVPYSIVHSTQFYEFLGGIAAAGDRGGAIHLSSAYLQPIASEDVARAVAEIALGDPINDVTQIAGPVRERLTEVVQRYLKLINDPREVVVDDQARYFGARLQSDTLIPMANHWVGEHDLESWFALHGKH